MYKFSALFGICRIQNLKYIYLLKLWGMMKMMVITTEVYVWQHPWQYVQNFGCYMT